MKYRVHASNNNNIFRERLHCCFCLQVAVTVPSSAANSSSSLSTVATMSAGAKSPLGECR